jgi:hypothetical protein
VLQCELLTAQYEGAQGCDARFAFDREFVDAVAELGREYEEWGVGRWLCSGGRHCEVF